MKNRHPCGACNGCCRNCPYLMKKATEKAVALPCQPMEALFIPAMAAIPESVSLPPPADSKIAIAPEEPTDSTAASGPEPALATFLQQYPKQGKLRVQTFLGAQAIPVEGAHVTVSRDFDGKPYVFYEGDTDSSGIVDQIMLPAAAQDSSLQPGLPQPSATYRLVAEHPRLKTLDTTVNIYENVKTIQQVQMALKAEG